eukprot:GEZU01010421.1.p2 GENE.GEZU01010421.1~~GEZU01010421.1.p2  ORF type:complete len:139 (-),score=10.38 GEZU01010421.1:313-729(-)
MSGVKASESLSATSLLRGDITLYNTTMAYHGKSMSVTTNIGDVTLNSFTAGNLVAKTTSGAIYVGIPTSYNGTISLVTTRGSTTVNGFSAAGAAQLDTDTPTKKIGSIPPGGNLNAISLNSQTGDLTVEACESPTCGL